MVILFRSQAYFLTWVPYIYMYVCMYILNKMPSRNTLIMS